MIRDPCGIGVDSYSRMRVVLNNRLHMPRSQWFEQLGQAWDLCDNIAVHRVELRRILSAASVSELQLMMTAEERKKLATLSDKIEIWRGCYAVNRAGLSWTMDRNIAIRFPTLHRYRRDGDRPILRHGFVRRDRAVLKLDRSESEIIASRVFHITEFWLTSTDAQID